MAPTEQDAPRSDNHALRAALAFVMRAGSIRPGPPGTVIAPVMLLHSRGGSARIVAVGALSLKADLAGQWPRSSRDSNLTHPSTDQTASSGRRRRAGELSLSSTCEKRGEVLPWSREIETLQLVGPEHGSFAASVAGRCGTLDTLPGVPRTAHRPARTAYPRGTQSRVPPVLRTSSRRWSSCKTHFQAEEQPGAENTFNHDRFSDTS
jgi:hypothetical protein